MVFVVLLHTDGALKHGKVGKVDPFDKGLFNMKHQCNTRVLGFLAHFIRGHPPPSHPTSTTHTSLFLFLNNIRPWCSGLLYDRSIPLYSKRIITGNHNAISSHDPSKCLNHHSIFFLKWNWFYIQPMTLKPNSIFSRDFALWNLMEFSSEFLAFDYILRL